MFRYNHFILLLFIFSVASSGTSLFDEKNFRALYQDKKAYQLGDGITVLVYETVQATSSASEGSRGEVNFNGDAGVNERRWSSDLNVGSSNSGDAATNRNGFVRAQLTAVVIGFSDSGNLLIEGTQKITVNDEQQIVKVRGMVRPEDISGMNTVPSFRLQNAEISIDGDGEVSKGKEGNVFVRLLKWMGF